LQLACFYERAQYWICTVKVGGVMPSFSAARLSLPARRLELVWAPKRLKTPKLTFH
jgi:hypothetical protein